MGAPKGAPVNPPSTISSTALMYEESSEARNSTALASSSGSPHRPRGTVEDYQSASLADCSADIEARDPRFQNVVLLAPGTTTLTRMLRGARSAAIARAIETAALRGRIGRQAGLAHIVLHRSVEDDACVVVQQRSGGVDGEECAVQVRMDDILERCFVRGAGRRPAANSGIGEDDVQLAEILGKIREQSLR